MGTERLLRIDEAAAALNLKPSTLRAWVLHRKILITRIGSRAVRVPESEVLRLISEGLVPRRSARGNTGSRSLE